MYQIIVDFQSKQYSITLDQIWLDHKSSSLEAFLLTTAEPSQIDQDRLVENDQDLSIPHQMYQTLAFITMHFAVLQILSFHSEIGIRDKEQPTRLLVTYH